MRCILGSLVLPALSLIVLALSGCSEEGQQSRAEANACLTEQEPDYVQIRPDAAFNLAAFAISSTETTNVQFAKFVEETGYVTDAEKKRNGQLRGGAVFVVPKSHNEPWWRYASNVSWQTPDGNGEGISGHENDPVVQISYRDATAYAEWVGGRLPTEAEWEYAAGAGATTKYAWGNTKTIDGKEQANTWQGFFPVQNTQEDGFLRRAPVGCFPPNSFGLYDMIGNVWEWTASPTGSEAQHTNIIKGGSFLCADNYCQRYTVPAREKHERDFSTNHVGFRVVKNSQP